MDHIESFLHKKRFFPELLKKEACVKIINEITGACVLDKHVSFSGKKVVLKILPKERLQVMMHKKKVLEAFQKNQLLTFYTELQ